MIMRNPTNAFFAALSIFAIVALASCAAINSAQTGKPLDPAQAQQDLAITKEIVKDTACVAKVGAAVATPAINDQGDAAAQAAIKDASAGASVLCPQ
jgi:Na+-translocating ferredoxin:NAD+ oxidoreductase RnfG subunit